MKYIVNPFDVTTSDCNCNCSSACNCNCTIANVKVCDPNICALCESNCINNCTGTNSVASPTSFNF